MEIYALCEAGREAGFLSFLRKLKREHNWPVTAVLEESSSGIVDPLVQEQLVETICSAKAELYRDIRCSVYPSISRTTLYQMSVGMDTGMLPAWLTQDFAKGRSSVIITRGLDPFTGVEPKEYQEKILGYIKDLMKLGVGFTTEEQISSESGLQKKIYLPEISNRLLLAKTLRQIPSGGVIQLPKDTVITPLAKDYMRDHNITWMT